MSERGGGTKSFVNGVIRMVFGRKMKMQQLNRKTIFFFYCIFFPVLIVALLIVVPFIIRTNGEVDLIRHFINIWIAFFVVFQYVSIGVSYHPTLGLSSKFPLVPGMVNYYRLNRIMLSERIDASIFPIYFFLSTVGLCTVSSILFAGVLFYERISSNYTSVLIGFANFLLLVVPTLMLYRTIVEIVYPSDQ